MSNPHHVRHLKGGAHEQLGLREGWGERGVLFKFLLCSFNSPSPIPRSFSLPHSLSVSPVFPAHVSRTQTVGRLGKRDGGCREGEGGALGCYFPSAWRMWPLFLQCSFSAPEQSHRYLKLVRELVWNKSQNTWSIHAFFSPAGIWIMNPCEVEIRQYKDDTAEIPS